MQQVTLLKVLFALIAILLLMAYYLKDQMSCSICYLLSIILLSYSIYITIRLSNKDHTRQFKIVMITIQSIFILISLVGYANCYMPVKKINLQTKDIKLKSAFPMKKNLNIENMKGGLNKIWAGIGTPTLF